MTYKVEINEQAECDLLRLFKYEPKAFQKAQALLDELRLHPKTGTGHPEQLKGFPCTWSRHITKKHRLVYEVHDMQVIVLVLTAYGHYDDR